MVKTLIALRHISDKIFGVRFREMSTTQVWILAIIGLGLFIYFVPYKNIKIVHKKLDTIIELLNKRDNK